MLTLLLAASCDGASTNRELRQGTTSYQFTITVPNARPSVRDDVTYVIVARDRTTNQPIESGEGRIFARAGAELGDSLVKAPQVGQYTGTLRFPSAGGWVVGVQFRDQRVTAFEHTQWVQEVRSATPADKSLRLAQPKWPWRGADRK
jgi:hypothetical protein